MKARARSAQEGVEVELELVGAGVRAPEGAHGAAPGDHAEAAGLEAHEGALLARHAGLRRYDAHGLEHPHTGLLRVVPATRIPLRVVQTSLVPMGCSTGGSKHVTISLSATLAARCALGIRDIRTFHSAAGELRVCQGTAIGT